MKRRLHWFLVLLLAGGSLSAHVGSPNVTLQGMAGPYRLLVEIAPPDVIPGTAVVTVFLQNAGDARIYTRPIYFFSGQHGAPPPDQLQPVQGQPGQYKGIVWMMDNGSSSVQLTVTGSLGRGEMIVPVVAVSTAQKQLPPAVGYSLAILGAILFILMVTIIGASVSEGITRKGEVLPAARRRSRTIAIGAAALFFCLLAYGGKTWWENSERKYRRFMFKPMHASYRLDQEDGRNVLLLTIDTLNEQRKGSLSYIVPDHGKLMHLFLMRMPAMDAFAHLHPARLDSATYKSLLPPLPKGKYLAFADIVYNSGFTETMKDTFTLTQNLRDSLHKMDPDDTYAFALPDNMVDNPFRGDENAIVCGKPGSGVTMKDGSVMIMDGAPSTAFESGVLYTLRFSVYGPDKRPAGLSPYLGMMGHAAIVRDDGSTYVHLHPVGTYSMAAQQDLRQRLDEKEPTYRSPDRVAFRDSVDRLMRMLQSLTDSQRNTYLIKEMNMPMASGPGMDGMTGMNEGNVVTFPYTFPQPGMYRIWVMVKRDRQILTAAFDRLVK
ncbi:MAG: hypothetical protein Q8927_19315 [Bacteroidota bacterium]|nr:hypothetical protein [Bacteroidota bacterium]MDP4247828.1 hypothetical protein [Bacteroidota bacterium]MDP4257620.1 hypothetical protein [Bacteroidota bacterium]